MREAGPCAALQGLALLVGAASAVPAAAQHGTTGFSVMPMDPQTSAMLETEIAGFDLPGRAGIWQTASARLEYAFVPWFSLAVRPVLAHVDYDDGPAVVGLSDTEFTAKARLFRLRAQRISMSAGLSLELPTGDADDGTGNDHVSLFPLLTFSSMPNAWFMLHAMAGYRLVVAGEPHDPATHAGHAGHTGGAAHGSVIMPHGEQELAAHAGVCFTLERLFVISPGLEWMQTFEPAADTQLFAQLELALLLPRGLRVAAGADLPLVEQPRYAWRLRLMTAWLF